MSKLSTRHPRAANTLLVVVSIVLAVVIIDLVAYNVFDIKRMGSGSDRFIQTSSLLGWEHRPNASGTWYAYKDGTRTQVSINSFGFSDADRDIHKDRPRIALVGDSTTEFWEVDQPRRGQYALEEALDKKYEVLNFGLRGAGTDQQYIRLTNQVVHFSPDIVVHFFCINDFANNIGTEGKPFFVVNPEAPDGLDLQGYPVRWMPTQPAGWLRTQAEKSFTLRTIKYFATGIRTHLRTEVPLDDHFELRPFKRTYDAEDERRSALLVQLISAMKAFAEANGMKFLLVEGVYKPALDPTLRQQVLDSYGDVFDFDKPSAILTTLSRRDGIEYVSLPAVLRARNMDINDVLAAEDTMHLNARGVELFASAIAERIEALGW